MTMELPIHWTKEWENLIIILSHAGIYPLPPPPLTHETKSDNGVSSSAAVLRQNLDLVAPP